MCGIAGIVSFTGEPAEVNVLEQMGRSMAHRGPDDGGVYRGPGVALIHRRLSILDLSQGGHQPMSNPERNLWIVFNGEIYNFMEIKNRLIKLGYSFQTASDTEVVIAAYQAFGQDCLKLFNGMFSFVIWDVQKKQLFAARDRIGIKPFFYYYNGSTFVFSSEIKTILQSGKVGFSPNPLAIQQYALHAYTTDDLTWYKEINKLLPGQYLFLDVTGIKIKTYWELQTKPDYTLRFENCIEELKFLLRRSIHEHLVSDVPVGAHLSGGIDSSSIVSLMSERMGPGIPTFSGNYEFGEQYSEQKFINLIVSRFSTDHHQIHPTAHDFTTLLYKLIWHLDEPTAGPGAFSQMLVCQLIKDAGIKVVNGGQGGDELFGGYPRYLSSYFRTILNNARRLSSFPPLTELIQLPGFVIGHYLSSKFLPFLNHHPSSSTCWRPFSPSPLAESLENVLPMKAEGSPFEMALSHDIKYYLPALLHIEDRTSMAHSIESRVPMLDHRIVEFAARLPPHMKIRHGTLKAILREAMRGTVPDDILKRKDKKGFPTPIDIWFREEALSWISNILLNRPLLADAWVDQKVLATMIPEHASGVANHSRAIWSALNLELWALGNDTGWSTPSF